MAEEVAVGVGEELFVEMVDCTPQEPTLVKVPLPEVEVDSPVRQGFKAKIEQVGAEPPPMEGDL